jgi:hypothetical protein
MLQWPAISRSFTHQGIKGAPDAFSPHTPLPDGGLDIDLSNQGAGNNFWVHVGSSMVSWELVGRLIGNYFAFHNLMYPLLDNQHFVSATLQSSTNSYFGNDPNSALVLLVLALGEVADAASHQGQMKGSAGIQGVPERPPGLAFFNEARKRMGFVLPGVTVESVQIYVLASLYYESCGFYTVGLLVSAC